MYHLEKNLQINHSKVLCINTLCPPPKARMITLHQYGYYFASLWYITKMLAVSSSRKANQKLFIMPIESILKDHLLRSEYVLHMFFNSVFKSSIHCFEKCMLGLLLGI